jgi:hypothetical protein
MADPLRYPDSKPDTGDDTGVGPDRDTGMPRWVWVSGIVALVLILLIVIMMLTGVFGGEHGPGRHTQSGDTGGQVPPSSVVMEDHTPPEGDH